MANVHSLSGRAVYIAVFLSTLTSFGQSQRLVIFGDSLSDTGLLTTNGGFARTAQLTLQTDEVFPQTPYYQGRYSNGPVWVDAAIANLSIPVSDLLNWAAGGATSGAGVSQQGPLPAGFAGYPSNVLVLAPNLYQQVSQYFQTINNTVNSTDVHLIFIGANDYFNIANNMKNITAKAVVGNISNAMNQLYTAGARQFILTTLPPIAALPSFANNTALVQALQGHNPALKTLANTFNQTHKGSLISVFDWEAITNATLANATQLGFTASGPCYPVMPPGYGLQAGATVCSNPQAHFSWDGLHPTTATHAYIAMRFTKQFEYLWRPVSTSAADLNSTTPIGG